MLFAPRKGQGHQFVRIMLELKTWIHISGSYAYKMFIILAVNISEELCSAVKSGRGTWHQRPVIGSVD